MNIRKMSIGQRLALGFFIVIALLVMLAGLSFTRIADLNGEVGLMANTRYPKTVAANQVKSDVNELTRSMLNVLIMTDPTQIKKEISVIEAKSASAAAAINELAKSTTDAQGLEILKAIGTIRERFDPSQASFVSLVNEDKKDEALIKFMF